MTKKEFILNAMLQMAANPKNGTRIMLINDCE